MDFVLFHDEMCTKIQAKALIYVVLRRIFVYTSGAKQYHTYFRLKSVENRYGVLFVKKLPEAPRLFALGQV